MIGERLRNIRESKGLSMKDVSKATRITNSRLSKIERGITKHPTLNDICILLDLYEIPLIAFLCQEGYCTNDFIPLKNLDLLNKFEREHIQAEIDFILKEKGLQNGI